MHLPEGAVNELVPTESPPHEYIPLVVAEQAERIEDPVLRLSYLWANAITVRGFESSVALPPRFSHFSAGFIYIWPESLEKNPWISRASSGFVFGAYILVKPVKGKVGFQYVVPMELGDMRIPVVINFGSFVPHGLPPHPHTGSGTCWVENDSMSGSWQKGILTCRHTVASFSIGQSINLSPSSDHKSPTSGVLIDIDECTIDAAVIKIQDTTWPKGLTSLPIFSPVAPGQNVEFKGRSSTASGSILRVFQYPTYIGNLFGQRVITDCHGVRGDSGALLAERFSRKGVGIYMGIIPDGGGGNDGMFQCLNQASSYFQLHLYT